MAAQAQSYLQLMRQPEREPLNRFIKTLDEVLIMQAREGLGYSQF